jgi:hypothetical protein
MNGEQRGQRREQEFAPVLDPGKCGHANGAKNSAADKIRSR